MKRAFGGFVAVSGALGYIYGTIFTLWPATYAVVRRQKVSGRGASSAAGGRSTRRT